MLSLIDSLGQVEPIVTALSIMIIFLIIVASIMIILGICGFILKCTKYEESNFEKIISWIYSSNMFLIIVLFIVIFALTLAWSSASDVYVKSGVFVVFGIVYFLPYFASTKMHMALAVTALVILPQFGIIIYLIHDKVFSRRTIGELSNENKE